MRWFCYSLSIAMLVAVCTSPAHAQLTSPQIGWEAELNTMSHNVSGTVSILDEDTLQFDDFTYDGGGLSVYFYLGTADENPAFSTGLQIGPQLVGPAFDGTQEPFFVDLPANQILEGWNAISVWCVTAGVNFGSGSFAAVFEPALALVDIKPGSFPNSVNLKSKGVLPVAILSTDDFDVNDVDIDTLLFGDPLLIDNGGTAVGPLRSAYEDVSGDGLLDLTLKFSTADLVEYDALGPDTIEGLLTGALLDGTPFTGMDAIRIVPPNGSNRNSLQISAVPEPSTLALTALGLLGMGYCRRKRA